MFENLIKELNNLSKQQTISVPIETDSDGFFDKECPSKKCLFNFKIHGDDWEAIVSDEEVFCPSCKHSAPAQSWYTTSQIEAAQEYAYNTVGNAINKAMRADASASRRRQNRNAFFSITLEAKGGKDAILLPIEAADPMRLTADCEECKCRYSYIGAAYFCPSCGTNSADHMFEQTISMIRTSIGLHKIFRETLSPDEAEVLIITLLEKAMLDVVTSFQRLNEQLYLKYSGKTARRNVFQNLEAGGKIWKEEIKIGFNELTTSLELKKIQMYFQQRHLLAHQQGIVDQDYIKRSNDNTYIVGQKLKISETDVFNFSNLIEQLALKLMQKLQS